MISKHLSLLLLSLFSLAKGKIGGGGDPHFKTWGGEEYDFRGVCDLVLLQNSDFNGVGMDIHVRTDNIGPKSYIHAAVVRIGDDTIEVMGGKDGNRFWVNKKSRDPSIPTAISGYPVIFSERSPSSRQFVIDLGNDEEIKIHAWNSMVSVHVKSDNVENFGNSLGLMGTFQEGEKMARDSTTIVDDLDTFGHEWQVLHTEPMLFHGGDGHFYPRSCDMPTTTTQSRRRLSEVSISKEDARFACAEVNKDDYDLCVFDVIASNDLNVVGAY